MCPLPVTACTSCYTVLEIFPICFHGLIQTCQAPAGGSGVGASDLTLLLAEETSQIQQVSRRVGAVPKDGDPDHSGPRPRDAPLTQERAISSCPVGIFSCCSYARWLLSCCFDLLRKVWLCHLCHFPFRMWKMQLDQFPTYLILHLFNLLSFQLIHFSFPCMWFQSH